MTLEEIELRIATLVQAEGPIKLTQVRRRLNLSRFHGANKALDRLLYRRDLGLIGPGTKGKPKMLVYLKQTEVCPACCRPL